MSVDFSSFVADVKERHSIAAVVGRHIRLEKRGNLLKGLCPFHGEKTPSFVVYDHQGTYHCFGCGEHGDILTFTMAMDKCDFNGALEKLAHEVGLTVPTQKNLTDVAIYDGARKALSGAAMYYTTCLHRPGGQKARDYLTMRGIDDLLQKEFGLGYAPVGSTLGGHLASLGMGVDDLQTAGLVGLDDGSGGRRRFYDRFRDRLMFPIHDKKGQVVAFGGRAFGDADAKYLNSPETPLFHKGHLLYNHHRAQGPIRRGAPLLVVEGYMDVIRLWSAGFQGAVAPLGTALTDHQLTLLWRLSDRPIFIFDGDAAGQKAALKAAFLILTHLKTGFSATFVSLPDRHDPDSFVRENGAPALQDLLGRSISLADFLWTAMAAHQPTGTPEQKAALEKTVFDRLSLIPDRGVMSRYKADFKDRFYHLYRSQGAKTPWKAGGQKQRQGGQTGKGSPGQGLLPPVQPPLSLSAHNLLLGCLYYHPSVIGHVYEELMDLSIQDGRLDHIRQGYLAWVSTADGSDPQGEQKLGAAGQKSSDDLENSFRLFLREKHVDELCAPFRSLSFRQLCPPARDERMGADAVLTYWKNIHRGVSLSKGLDFDRQLAQEELRAHLSADGWERLKILEQQRQSAKTVADGDDDS